jgi:hypothetical protein
MTSMSSFATSWTISAKSYSCMNTTRFEEMSEFKRIGKKHHLFVLFLSPSISA